MPRSVAVAVLTAAMYAPPAVIGFLMAGPDGWSPKIMTAPGFLPFLILLAIFVMLPENLGVLPKGLFAPDAAKEGGWTEVVIMFQCTLGAMLLIFLLSTPARKDRASLVTFSILSSLYSCGVSTCCGLCANVTFPSPG